MKKIAIPFLAAVLGSGFTLGVHSLLDEPQQDRIVAADEATVAFHSTAMPNTLSQPVEVAFDFTKAAALVNPSVVHIKSTIRREYAQRTPQNIPFPFREFFGDQFGQPRAPQSQEGQASGSGVLISKDGYIVTNNHVIDGATEVKISLYDKREYPATVVGTDPNTDIALLKVEESVDLPFLTFGNSDAVRVGQWVLAVGNPFDLESTVTAGIVSAKGRNISLLNKGGAPIESFIQTDAAVNPGNSGGALVNTNGELIGINTAIASPTGSYAGYSFAVPSDLVRKVVSDLKEYGAVQRAYLGINIRPVTGELATDKDLTSTRGVYIAGLSEGGAAEKGGLKEGDVILSIDGRKVNSVGELQENIARKKPGQKLEVVVERDRARITVPVQLQDFAKGKIAANEKVFSKLGARFKELSAEEAEEADVPYGIQLVEVLPGKLSAQSRMQRGFIITKADRQPVKSIKDLDRILGSAKDGVLIEGKYPGGRTEYFGLGM